MPGPVRELRWGGPGPVQRLSRPATSGLLSRNPDKRLCTQPTPWLSSGAWGSPPGPQLAGQSSLSQLPGQPDPQCPAVTTLNNCPSFPLATIATARSAEPPPAGAQTGWWGLPLLRLGYFWAQCGCGAVFWRIICLAKWAKWQGRGCEFTETRVSCVGLPPRPCPLGCTWDPGHLKPKATLSHGLP